MFSRRHPYLFFLLTSFAIFSVFTISMAIIISIAAEDSEFEFGEKVGLVEITGVITDAREVLAQLKRFRQAENIKAIVVRIDSPGGAVGPAQEIYREIVKTSGEKRVVASLGAVAASGGYYIAAAADHIVASPGTITGSIGVILSYTNYRALLDKIGLSPVVIKSGEYKDMGSPSREMSPEERQLLEGITLKIHRQFVRDVIKGRKLSGPQEAQLREIADGRIFTGEEFKTMGLVDRLGNLEDAIEWAGRLGGIEGPVEVATVRQRPFTILEYLLGSDARQWLRSLATPELYPGFLYRP